MKISELKSAIREMIINELDEATYAGKSAEVDIKKDPEFNALSSTAKEKSIQAR